MKNLLILFGDGLIAMLVGAMMWYFVHWVENHDIVKAQYAVINFWELMLILFIVGLVVGRL